MAHYLLLKELKNKDLIFKPKKFIKLFSYKQEKY